MVNANIEKTLKLDLGTQYNSINGAVTQLGNLSISKAQSLVSAKVHPAVLLSILDHFLRRTEEQTNVIGTLLGTRSEDGSIIEIRSCFPVSHTESENQVAVDMDYHRAMYELHHKVNKQEIIVGWYGTGTTLNPYSSLIQDFYQNETAPFNAVHLVMDTTLKGGDFGIKGFTSSLIGVSGRPENCIFKPINCDIQLHRAERSALDVLSVSKDGEISGCHPLLTDANNLIRSMKQVQAMLTRVQTYVKAVLDGSEPANPIIGRYLMDTLATVPKIDPEHFEKTFNAHVQDLLMVVYLANLTRSQLALTENIQSLL